MKNHIYTTFVYLSGQWKNICDCEMWPQWNVNLIPTERLLLLKGTFDSTKEPRWNAYSSLLNMTGYKTWAGIWFNKKNVFICFFYIFLSNHLLLRMKLLHGDIKVERLWVNFKNSKNNILFYCELWMKLHYFGDIHQYNCFPRVSIISVSKFLWRNKHM